MNLLLLARDSKEPLLLDQDDSEPPLLDAGLRETTAAG